MPRPLTVVLALALAVALPAAAAAAPAKRKPKKKPPVVHTPPKPPPVKPPAPSGFTPAVLAGTWSGTWKNQTFGTSGTLTLTFDATATSLAITPTLTGNVFGCPAPAPATFTVAQGTGPNTWGASGFTYSGQTALGTVTATYSYPAGTISLAGSSVPCAPGLAWKIDGTFSGGTLNATVAITLGNGQPATSVIALTKQ